MQTVLNYLSPLIAFVLICFTAITSFGQTAEPAVGEISKCWFYPFADSSSIVALSADSNQVYLALKGGRLETISRNGRKVWVADLGGAISSNPLTIGNSVVLVTSALGPEGTDKKEAIVRSLSKETGITLWTARIEEARWHSLAAFNGWITVVSNNGTVSALDTNGGKLLWRREIAAGFVGKPVLAGSKLALATVSNQIFTISLLNGEIEWVHKTDIPAISLAWGSDGAVVTGDERGNLISIRIDSDKQNWRFKSGGQIASLFSVGNDLVAVSYDNFIYSINERGGSVNWKRRLSGRLSYISQFGGSFLWLSALDDNGVIVIDPRNGKVVGRAAFGEGERLAAEPVISENMVVTVSTKGAYGFSVSGCSTSNEGDPAQN